MDFRQDIGAIAAAQDTPEGYRKIYMRIARVGPMDYYRADGTKRIEYIESEDLFNPKSIATAKRMPILDGHPGFGLDSKNIGGMVQGALGENFVKEHTDSGDFLGVVGTLYTDSIKRASEMTPGVSPGYRVRVERKDSTGDEWWQRDREYNHVAANVVGRGKDAAGVLEGVRVDAADSLWVARFDSSLFDAPTDDEFISRVFNYQNQDGRLVEKTPVDLTPYVSAPTLHRANDDSCDCAKCAAKKDDDEDDTRGQGFGASKRKTKRKRMDTTDVLLGGVTYRDVPTPLAQAVAAQLERSDSMATKVESHQDSLIAAQTDLAEAHTRIDELQAMNAALLEDIETRDDSEPEFDESQLLDWARAYAQTVNRVDEFGQMLVKAGRIDAFPSKEAQARLDSEELSTFDYIVENLGELQQEMVQIASPRMATRMDSDDPESIGAAFEFAFDMLRDSQATEQRSDSTTALPGILQVGQNLRHDGGKGKKVMTKEERMKMELEKQNAAFDNVGQSEMPVAMQRKQAYTLTSK